ncbi:MAG TPA: hypothetical protein VEU30_09090 [Thermoanaerobaculia bacterium]|nr:hypothetical protein [Thermoanaerobaculia bacterium]
MFNLTFIYAAYLTVTVGVTALVVIGLRRKGRAFLVDAFGGNESLADAANHLFLVTFCPIACGVIALVLPRWGGRPDDLEELIELLSIKVGIVFIVLGVLHSLKVRRLAGMRRRALEQQHVAQRREA